MQTLQQQRYQLLQPHLRGAQLLAQQLLQCQSSAEDCLHDALISAITTTGFPETAKVKAWFLQVVRFRSLDLLRQRKKLTTLDSISTLEEVVSTPLPAESNALQALSLLPFAQRDVLVLRELNDCSYAEIATIMQIPQGTVMSRLARAREALRLQLQQLERGDKAND
ncbi:RNA polymerase sigma factor [Pseudidiomarina salilacus]|uniref:RNA polymerase sigma factor n=1 Tax=Pseudidiomarina salilacus TaxID=3384452 RepID=UPI0039854E2B